MSFLNFIRIATVLCFVLGVLGPNSAMAGPPSQLKQGGRTWVPHAYGIRTYGLIDVYQCAIYRPQDRTLTSKQLVASIKTLKTPVAIRIQILTSMLPDKMPEVWKETVKSEVTGKAFHRFRKGFARLDEGDVLLFVYLPGEATRLFLNNKPVFKDPGPGLMQSLLEQWVGSQPISEDLKQALLGG